MAEKKMIVFFGTAEVQAGGLLRPISRDQQGRDASRAITRNLLGSKFAHRITVIGMLGMLAFTVPIASAQSLDVLYQSAKAEGTLVLYEGGPTAPWEATGKEFSARYPGVTVKVTGGKSNILDKQIDSQFADGRLNVDLVMLQTLQDFARWKQEGVLLEFKPQGFDKIDPGFKDADGAYVGVATHAHLYAYNPDLVKPAEVPRSALDFLAPRFKGKVVSCYPTDDDSTLYTFYSIVQKYGWSYMDRYMANQPRFIEGHLGVARSIASGQSLVTFDTIASFSMDQKNQGQPQGIAFSQDDALPIWPYTAAVFKSAPHVNAAKLFLSWYLAPEQQAKIGTWSPRSDVPAPYGWKAIMSYKVVNNYREFLASTRQLEELRKRFESYIGPIKDGVR
jgi:ABC-type Fe3+ transport system substrate-binding protein